VEENQYWQKEIVVYWGVFRKFTELLQHRWQQSWIFFLKTLFLSKLSDVSIISPTSTVGLQLLNLWLLKVIFRCIDEGLTTINPGHQTNGNSHVIESHELSFTHIKKSLCLKNTELFPTSRRVYIWRTPNPECLVPTVKHWGRSAMVWEAISWHSFVGPIITFMA
jgi:hypothetical protein